MAIRMADQTTLSRRGFITGSAGGLAGLTAAGLLASANAGQAADGKPIPIGAAVPLTGWAAADGIEYKRGLELAAEEVNALGGILGRPARETGQHADEEDGNDEIGDPAGPQEPIHSSLSPPLNPVHHTELSRQGKDV